MLSDYKYFADVVSGNSLDGFSDAGLITSGCLVFVYDAGTKTLSTIYSDQNRTSLANPITRAQFATDGKIKFWGAASTYDVFIADDKGNVVEHLNLTPSKHRLSLDKSDVDKCLVFAIASNTTETDTGLVLPYKAHVTDIAVEVVAAHSGKTLDIGLLSSQTAGDADGLIAAISVASTGFVKPVVATAGGNETYISSVKYGALMGPVIVGTDVDKDNGLGKGYGHVVDGANANSITYTASSGTTTLTGYGYVYFKQVR